MPTPQRRRREDGARTFQAILRMAADLASLEGLDALTIGTLAERLGMSKSGLFAHFGSKEELQLATVEAARERYVAAVLAPALKAPAGIARLEAVCARTIEYLEKPEFPGGCFFAITAAEFHARTGPVRDAIARNKRYARTLLARVAADARARGELAADADAEQLAFELVAMMDAATWSVAGEHKGRDLRHASRAMHRLIDGARAPAQRGKRRRR